MTVVAGSVEDGMTGGAGARQMGLGRRRECGRDGGQEEGGWEEEAAGAEEGWEHD